MQRDFSRVTDDNALEKSLAQLDLQQRLAATDDAAKIVVEAPAGSGKTSCLIAAIANYRYEHLNDKISAITYTRAARTELEERLKLLGVFDVEVATIHSWSRNRLADLAIKYGFKIKVLEEPQIRVILETIIEDYKKKSGIRHINLDIFLNYIIGSKRMDLTPARRATFIALEKRYIKFKRDNNLYDFTDYPLYLYDILKVYNETVKGVDALFVDEFQDVDNTQLQIFEKVESKKNFYIGDFKQSIYSFRGADGDAFNKLKGFKELSLVRNYRSYQEIINYATTVYNDLKQKYEDEQRYNSVIYDDLYEPDDSNVGSATDIQYSEVSDIECIRGYGGQVFVIDMLGNVASFGESAAAAQPKEIVENFMNMNPMILCRTNNQVKYIKDLGYLNVDTIHQAKGLEYDNVIAIDSPINNMEDINVMYVALTRAKDNLLVINWNQFELLFKLYMNKIAFGG